MNDGGKLAGYELIEQVMGVLRIDGHCVLPSDPLRNQNR